MSTADTTHSLGAPQTASQAVANSKSLAADEARDKRPLSKEQKAAATEADERKKAADEKAEATAKADEEFKADVAKAVEKRKKALEKFVDASTEGIVAAAYEETKGPGDPPYGEVILEYRQKLNTHADAVLASGLSEKPTDFEKKVAELLGTKEYKALGANSRVNWSDTAARKAELDSKDSVIVVSKSDAKDAKGAKDAKDSKK